MQNLSRRGAFSLLATACLTIMVGCVIVPGLPSIARHLGVEGHADLLVTLPALGVVLFGPVAGWLIDRVGTYRAVCIGLLLYGLLGAGGALLAWPVLVFIDRLLLGGATALVMAGGTGLISTFYEGQARLQMIARQGMSIELGGVIFLFLGGVLATLGWRWPFALYLTAWLMLAMVWMWVPRPAPAARRSADNATRQALPQALKRVLVCAVLSMIVFFSAIIALPLRLEAMGLNEAETGYFLAFVSLVAVVAAALMPGLVARLQAPRTLALAFACYGLAHGVFALAPGLGVAILGGVLLGAGFGFSVPLVNHLTVEQSPAPVRGRNLAYLSMAIFSGQFLCAGIDLIPGSSTPVFVFSGVLGLAASLWQWRLQDRHVAKAERLAR